MQAPVKYRYSPAVRELTAHENFIFRSGTAFDLTLDHAITADRTVTIQDASDTLVGRATTDTLTNKTLTTPVIPSLYQVGAGNLISVPAATGADIVALLGQSQTLTNKTLTAPDINGGTADSLTALSVRNAGTGAYDVTIAVNQTLTAGRVLSLTIPDAATALTLTGDFIRVGAHSLTLTTGATTNVTLPASGTLATLAGTETLTNKTLIISDDILFSLGTNSDIALLNRSTSLTANTTLAGVFVGTPIVPALAANSLIISNITADGDIILATQTGGNSQSNIFIDASAGSTHILAAGISQLNIALGRVNIYDDIILQLGTGGDQALVNRSTTLTANTALGNVLIGTPVTPALAANSLIISNITADGDILIAGNDGGNSKACLFFDANTPDLYLYNVGGTWTAGATAWTIPAVTLGGTLTLNSQAFDAGSGDAQINTTGSVKGLKISASNVSHGGRIMFDWTETTPPLNSQVMEISGWGFDGNASPATLRYFLELAEITNITDGAEASIVRWYLVDSGATNQAMFLTGAGHLTLAGGLAVGGDIALGANNITLGATQTVDGIDVSAHDVATTGVHGAGASTLLHTGDFATPSVVLGTAAAAGSATTLLRTDCTIAAFDATVPVTQAFGDSAATGSATVAARRDHVHGMMASPVPSGLIAIWHGTIANIPAGWVICDGNNSTPNLLTKFIQGVATAGTDPGATGGAATHTLLISEIPAHTHFTASTEAVGTGALDNVEKGTPVTVLPTSSAGGGGAHENEPTFYDVAFIMKT